MNRTDLEKIVNQIMPLNQEAMELAKERQLSLAKPPRSLGKLEDISIRLAGISGKLINDVSKQAIAVMSADNGVCQEGVASTPQSVTRAQTINFTRRLTGVGALAKNFSVDLLVTDIGIKDPIPAALYTGDPAEALAKSLIWNRKIRTGTDNLYKGPAMTEPETLQAMETGLEAAKTLKASGYNLIGVGEMGIGNTTTSSCLLSVLTGMDPRDTVGRGAGLNDAGYLKKIEVVETACARFMREAADVASPASEDAAAHTASPASEDAAAHAASPASEDAAAHTASPASEDAAAHAASPASEDAAAHATAPVDPISALATLGGFDIAAMAGVFIGAALYRIPVVIDGYISAVAAMTAAKIGAFYGNHHIADFFIASHKSYEKGYMAAMQDLGLEPILLLDMRLGEGSGCPIAFKVVEAAAAVMRDMATFEEAEINDDYLEEIRADKSCF